MSSKFAYLCLVVLVASAVGCSGIRVKVRHDRFTDFSKYKSYAWLPNSGVRSNVSGIPSGGMFDTRIIDAVSAELVKRGMEKESPEHADLLIGYQASVRKVLDGLSVDRFFGYSPSFEPRPPHEYAQGTLILDMVDRVKERTVWRGSAEGAVNPAAPERKRRERVREAVAELLEDFPPKPSR